jgi:hypothetical protein
MKMALIASKTNPIETEIQFTDLSAKENDFGCIQDQSLHKCEQISPFVVHGEKMQTN